MARSPDNPCLRLLPDEPLPDYAFIPGRFPHPESDPAGHSFGKPRPVPTFDADNWQSCRDYLRGIDLFNHGFPWESHVEFESLWIACGRTGFFADFFKALIHLAAANVKHLEGMPGGVCSHASRAAELLQSVYTERMRLGADDVMMGLSLTFLRALADTIGRDGWPKSPIVLIPELPR